MNLFLCGCLPGVWAILLQHILCIYCDILTYKFESLCQFIHGNHSATCRVDHWWTLCCRHSVGAPVTSAEEEVMAEIPSFGCVTACLVDPHWHAGYIRPDGCGGQTILGHD